jgi:uncharacterized metal-binding protein
MASKVPFVGIVSCSGEELPEGTTSRVACRKVLESLRPGKSVIMCLPLFIAGGIEERTFATKYPTIAVDGCDKQCASKATEKLSGKPAKSLIVNEILKKRGLPRPTKLRRLGKEEKDAAQAVAEEIVKAFDEIIKGT